MFIQPMWLKEYDDSTLRLLINLPIIFTIIHMCPKAQTEIFKSLTNRPKPKYIELTLIWDKMKELILPFQNLEQENGLGLVH